jgi:amino acid transporter
MPKNRGGRKPPQTKGNVRAPLDPQLHAPHALQHPRTLVQWVRRLLLGKPLHSEAALAHRLPILMALPLFASDALSSIAYATQEILRVLLTAGDSARGYLLPITLGIIGLMLIVAYSYRKAIFLYPTGGGSYAVARKNLGARAGLVTAAALVIDYNLTVAVSASAGMSALASYFQELHPWKPHLAIALVIFMALINLRGIRESGAIFALPAIVFIGSILLMVGTALFHYINGTVNVITSADLLGEPVAAVGTLGLFTLIWAFSSGCSALTGVEAVSNGVQVFKKPESQNAAKTLVIIIGTLIVLFLGVGFAAHIYQATPTETETVIAQLARAIFGHNLFYFLVIGGTLAILMVASNTVFAGMPQLLATLARDGYAPRMLLSLGDRLVYSRSIIGLAIVSSILIWVFKAEEHHLIPLYAVGVFLCFTMSQAGMLARALRQREPGWVLSALLNGLGMLVTGVVMIVLAFSRLAEGSWLVVVLIPALVLIGYAIKRHYQWFERRMSITPGEENPLAGPIDHLTVIVLLSSDIHRGTLEGLEAARAFVEGRKNTTFRALHIEMDAEKTKRLVTKWEKYVTPYIGHMIQLDIVPSPYRQLIPPIMGYINRVDSERADDRIVVLLPEFETGGFWTHLLHNQTAPRLRQALFQVPNVTVITNRFFMHDENTRPRLRRKRKKAPAAPRSTEGAGINPS